MASDALSCPDIHTERMLLRRHRPEDFLDCASFWADADVMRFIAGRPLSTEESWTRFLRAVGHWSVMGFGYWIVEEKASARVLGTVGFADYRRDIVPPLGDAPEIGWIFTTAAQGQGFAFEAVEAATRWGDTRFGGRTTCCIIAPDHVRSLRLAAKVGYRESHRALYRDQETAVLLRPGAGPNR